MYIAFAWAVKVTGRLWNWALVYARLHLLATGLIEHTGRLMILSVLRKTGPCERHEATIMD